MNRAHAFAVGSFLACSSCATDQNVPDSTDRPSVYGPTFPQFSIGEWEDPRVVTIERAGAGRERRAELWVFEIVDQGRRLRRLYQTELRNEFIPMTRICACAGRYFLTLDDHFSAPGSTDNCLVLYDLARGETKPWRLRELVPAERLSVPGKHLDVYWHGADMRVDPVRMLAYPTSPEQAKEDGYPFLVVDLPSLSVQLQDKIPDALPKEAYQCFANRNALRWEWSMGVPNEPAWNTRLALPKYLMMRTSAPAQNQIPIVVEPGVLYFKYDPERNEYVQCGASEWSDRPKNWPIRK